MATVGVDVTVDAVVAVGFGGVVAVGVGAVAVPPHAANSKAAIAATGMTFQNKRVRLANDNKYVFIKKSSLRFKRASLTNIEHM